MIRQNRVTLLLAQAVNEAGGLLNVLGAGWNRVTNGLPYAIAAIVEMPWESAGVHHRFRLELLDADGKPVLTDGPDGEVAVMVEGGFDVAPQPGVERGSPLNQPIAINLPPQVVEPGRYEWRFELDGETHEDWRFGFRVLPNPGEQHLRAA